MTLSRKLVAYFMAVAAAVAVLGGVQVFALSAVEGQVSTMLARAIAAPAGPPNFPRRWPCTAS